MIYRPDVNLLPIALRNYSHNKPFNVKMWLGLRPLRDLTKHLKARTDDGHAATDIEAVDYYALYHLQQ